MLKASSSCYVSDDGNFVFTAGGPTAHIHALTSDGAIGEQVDEVYAIPVEEIENVNLTRAGVVRMQRVICVLLFCTSS